MLVDAALQLLQQRVVVVAGVEDDDGLQVEAELLPRNHLHELFQRAAATGKGDAAVADVGDDLLALMHVGGLNEMGEAGVVPALFHHERGNHAGHTAAGRQTGIARGSHEAHIPGTVDQFEVAPPQLTSELAGGLEEVRVYLGTGSAIDGDLHKG